jgi:hypothetical protein
MKYFAGRVNGRRDMPESYRECPEGTSREDQSRIDRLRTEVETLRAQLAEVQSLRLAQAAVLEHLATQPEAIDEDRIQRDQARNSTASAPKPCPEK